MSDYFTPSSTAAPATRARASHVTALEAAVDVGFDMLPTAAVLKLLMQPVVTAGGTANALTVANSYAITSYSLGQRIAFKAASANTGAVSVNVDGVGAKNLLRPTGGALEAGEIIADRIYFATYDGTAFQLEGSIGLQTFVDAAESARDDAVTAKDAAEAAETDAEQALADIGTTLDAFADHTYDATSTTSVEIGTGTETFTIQADKRFIAGQDVVIASAADPTADRMWGAVASYSDTSLEVEITLLEDGASGTHTDWLIGIVGPRGATGLDGSVLPDFTGNAGKQLRVNAGETAAEWIDGGWVQIGQVVANNSSGTILFSSIPQTYEDLLLVVDGLVRGSASTIALRSGSVNDVSHSETVTASGTTQVNGGYLFSRYTGNAGALSGGLVATSADGPHAADVPVHAWQEAVSLIALVASTGNFTTGTVTLFAR